MKEYRRRFNIGTLTTHTLAIAAPTLMDQITMQYGISNMTTFNTPTVQALQLGSIDQEFDDYTNAVLLKRTDMVKFWHVSNIFAIFMI